MCYCTCNQEPGTQALLYRRALLRNKERYQTFVNDSSAEAQQAAWASSLSEMAICLIIGSFLIL